MAFGIVPDMTDENVVCQNPCTHEDCVANRRDFLGICRICGKGFEKGQSFCYDRPAPEPPVHFRCLPDPTV